jgi:hypothetical protein
MTPNIYKRIGDTLMVLAVAWFMFVWIWTCDNRAMAVMLPDASVYRLSKTDAASGHPGELMVECLNGGDATVRPQPEFGRIVVSCGK